MAWHDISMHDGISSKAGSHAGLNMRTIQYGLSGGILAIALFAMFSPLIGLPLHGWSDVVAAVIGFAVVVALRLRRII